MIARDVKKSNFVAKTASGLLSTATFDFVQNGQNFKITAEELISAFGTTGVLEQTGDATGISALQAISTTNYIRGVIGGSGVAASLSAENGIKLDHTFESGSDGVPVLIDETAATPLIRSLVAGDAIGISGSGDSVTIAYTGELPTTAANLTIVNEISDFPDPVGGVITLADDTAYLISGNLSTANRFKFGDNTTVQGSDSAVSSLTYTGTGYMFTMDTTTSVAKLKELTLVTASGIFLSAAGSGVERLDMRNNAIVCDKLGDVSDLVLFDISSCVILATTSGFVFTGDTGVISLSRLYAILAAGDFIDLGTSTCDSFSICESVFTVPSGSYVLTGAADSANINTDGLASVCNTRKIGDGDMLENISNDDGSWSFFNNIGIPNTRPACCIYNTGTIVSIAASSTPVLIGADWAENIASQFDSTSAGRVTFKGFAETAVSINATVSSEVASGVDTVTLLLYKNGSVVTGAEATTTLDAGEVFPLSLSWQEELETDDYFELWIQNDDSTANVEVINATFNLQV